MPSPGLYVSNLHVDTCLTLGAVATLFIILALTAPGFHTLSFRKNASMKPGFILTFFLKTFPRDEGFCILRITNRVRIY